MGKYADFLTGSFVVEWQGTIHLKPTCKLKDHKWKAITKKVEHNYGCWDHIGKQWILPDFVSPMNIPASKKKPNPSPLHIRNVKTLQNLLFLHDVFKGKRIKSWRVIQKALSSFRPERHKYSRPTCRDYLAALLALQPDSTQV